VLPAYGLDHAPPQALPAAVPSEAESLLSVLERNRRTFAWKTAGLDETGLRATTAASTMTIGGLVKHVALAEADWLAVKLAGEDYGPPWDGVDFDADPDWEWRTGALDAPDDIYGLWRDAVERSRAGGRGDQGAQLHARRHPDLRQRDLRAADCPADRVVDRHRTSSAARPRECKVGRAGSVG